MSWLGRLFGKRSPERLRRTILFEARRMADKATTAYLTHLKCYSELMGTGRTASPSGIGLLKARSHAVAMLAFCWQSRWPDDWEGILELFNLLSGVAVEPLVDGSSGVSVDLAEVKSSGLAKEYMLPVYSSFLQEIHSGPTTLEHETEGFRKMIELYQDALRESLGPGADFNTYPHVGGRFLVL